MAYQTSQKPYVRRREDPYFEGLTTRNDKAFTFDSHQKAEIQRNISRSISQIGDTGHSKRLVPSTSEKFEGISSNDIAFEPFEQFFPAEKSSKVAKPNAFPPFPFSTTVPNLSSYKSLVDQIDLTSEQDSTTRPILMEKTFVVNKREDSTTVPNLSSYKSLADPIDLTSEQDSTTRPTLMEKTFVVNKRKDDLSSIALPQSAASFYNGFSPQIEVVELCESAKRVNAYLKARKDDINAGVPGRFLHAVIGQDTPDVGSVASAIAYAFYLNETQSTDQFCTVPVINMRRADVRAHAELTWLLNSCQIDQTSLTFIDEVDLSYYDLFGGLKLVLLNGHKLPAKQEALKESVIEILTCRSKGESAYPWVQTVTDTEDGSSCTVIAEKFAMTSPGILVGKGFSKLLLAGILSDTGNLTNTQCSSKDKYMATLLIHSAGRLGCNGLYQTLRYKKHDVSDLKVIDILRKDFKRWTRSVGKPDGSRTMVSHIGMSSIAISLSQLLAHEGNASQQIKYFQQLEKLRLLMIVSGYNDSKNNFKREILISAESPEQMKNLLFFFNSNSTNLPLKVLNWQGLLEEMRAFEIDKVTSRKTIERLLEEFGGTSKG